MGVGVGVGVANNKASWKYSGGVVVKNLGLFCNSSYNDKQKQKQQEQHWRWWWWRPSQSVTNAPTSSARRPKISWSVKVCGVMLFAVGLISLFTGHLASDLELYSQRLVKRTLYYKLNGNSRAAVDIWESKFSNLYYGCSERGPHFARKSCACTSFRSHAKNYTSVFLCSYLYSHTRQM